MRLNGILKSLLVTTLLSGYMLGCAGDVDLIDRVQPNYIKKSDLIGEDGDKRWYMRRTVVDAPETFGPYMSIGTGDLFTIERLRWEIQEGQLLGYRDYEFVTGSEGAHEEGAEYYGSPVLSCAISKHFDIIKSYNSATGEETNVRSENASDRHWYERDYMRVNWCMSSDYLLPFGDFTMGGGEWIHPDDATNPWRARIEPENGFIDYVSKVYTIPDINTCYYEYDLSYECGAGEIAVRTSLTAIDEVAMANYDDLNFPDSVVVRDANGDPIADSETGEIKREPIFERFGYYRLDRLTFDQQRGMTESGKDYKIFRFDIWEDSLDDNGTAIPYAQRTPKPIIYYLNFDFPAELLETAMEVGTEWNAAFQETVASLQGLSVANVPDMFIVKENSCSQTGVNTYLSANTDVKELVLTAMENKALDATTLGNYCAATEYHSKKLAKTELFTWEQMGDTRYNMLNWITSVTPAAFSGYGPMLADPTNGRIVQATANILGWTIESAATRALEYVDYINGVLDVSDVITGSDFPHLYVGDNYDPAAAAPQDDLLTVAQKAKHEASPEYLEKISQRFKDLGDDADEMMVELENSEHFDERLQKGMDALFADHLMHPADLMVSSRGDWQPGMPLDDELIDQALHMRDSRRLQNKRDKTDRYFQERTFCPVAADLDDVLVGLASQIKDLSRDERRLYILKSIFKAVALHEVGHNVGLRHNFEASYDAVNYHQDFWDIENSGASDESKLLQSQPEYRYSSIMDYHGKINGDFRGLGHYDKAAIKFGYGQLVETFTDTNVTGGKAMLDYRHDNDYLKMDDYVGSAASMYNRTDVAFDPQNAPANEVPYMFCSDEYAGYTPTCKRFDFGANQREVQQADYVSYKNYFIFSNYLRNRITLNINGLMNRGLSRFRNVLTTYQYMYLYRTLRGDDFEGTDLWTDMNTAVADGFNFMAEVMAMPEPGYVYPCVNDQGTEGDTADDTTVYYSGGFISSKIDRGDDAGTCIGGTTDGAVCTFGIEDECPAGTVDGEAVEAGECEPAYLYVGLNDEVCTYTTDARSLLTIGDTQPLFLDFTDDFVAWTFRYVGTYWDKMSAMQELANPFATFFRINQSEDFRFYSVSPFRLFKPEILRFYRDLALYDRANLGSRLDTTTGKLLPPVLVNVDNTTPTEPTVFPRLTRNIQRYAWLFGNAFLTSPLDTQLDFAKYTRINVDGALDDISAYDGKVDGTDYRACVLPFSGLTYRALKVPSSTVADTYDDDNSIAYQLVDECATQVAAIVTLNDELEVLNTELVGLEDEAKADKEADIEDKENEIEWAQDDLNMTEQTLQYARLVHRVYEYGSDL